MAEECWSTEQRNHTDWPRVGLYNPWGTDHYEEFEKVYPDVQALEALQGYLGLTTPLPIQTVASSAGFPPTSDLGSASVPQSTMPSLSLGSSASPPMPTPSPLAAVDAVIKHEADDVVWVTEHVTVTVSG